MEPVWMWGILGLTLLAAEILSGTFYMLWFGIAALIVAALLWLFPAMPLALQLLLYSFLSLGSLFIWRRHYKKSSPESRVGQSQGYEIGRVGIVVKTIDTVQNGRIQFAQGVMGSREWDAVSDETIEAGSHAIIVAIEGNSLRVRKQ